MSNNICIQCRWSDSKHSLSVQLVLASGMLEIAQQALLRELSSMESHSRWDKWCSEGRAWGSQGG